MISLLSICLSASVNRITQNAMNGLVQNVIAPRRLQEDCLYVILTDVSF